MVLGRRTRLRNPAMVLAFLGPGATTIEGTVAITRVMTVWRAVFMSGEKRDMMHAIVRARVHRCTGDGGVWACGTPVAQSFAAWAADAGTLCFRTGPDERG
eukprot:7646252-Alexandrium_andersonii.AAC.1